METNFSQAEREADYKIAADTLESYNFWLGLRNSGHNHYEGMLVNDMLDKYKREHAVLAKKYGTSYLFAELLLVIRGEPVPAICE